jgi:prepilin-type N-terminal cleavage/methylation domain-containing protein
MRRPKAVTLIELLIASSIFLVVMVTIYSAFHSGVFGYRHIDEALTMNQSARQALERLNLDLRNSFAFSKERANFTGTKSSIGFLTLADTFSKDTITRDFAFVSYSLDGKKLMRLCRKNTESFNQASQIQSEEMASDIEAITFSYGYKSDSDELLKFDKDTWDDESLMPLAVKIKLTLKNTRAQDFERTIYLPLAQ